jgi:heme A synthase
VTYDRGDISGDKEVEGNRRFAGFARFALALNIFVIVWGAFVRASGSGAGCGSHWPLCNGEVIPRAERIETLIELSHRTTAGLALIVVVALVVWAWRAYGLGHPIWVAALLALFFEMGEAAIGAGLVLLEYVATNVSVARAYWMAGHLVNTFFLIAALALTAWWASGGGLPARWRDQGAEQNLVRLALLPALLGMLVLGASGAVTALGDTLHLTAGIALEESPFVAQLVGLRVYHPLLAVGVGALALVACLAAIRHRPAIQTRRLAWVVMALFVTQLLAGAFNVVLKAPIWMQLLHLLLADLIWIALVLLASETLARRRGEALPAQPSPVQRQRLA